MKLTDIKNCHVCNSNNLIPKYNIPVPDMFTDEETKRDVLFCGDCETMHYIEDGGISYEFTTKINQSIFDKKIGV